MKKIEELKSLPAKTLVMFTGDACPACDAMKPLIQRAQAELGVNALYVAAADSRELCQALGLRRVPALVVAGEGESLLVHTGALALGKLLSIVHQHGLAKV